MREKTSGGPVDTAQEIVLRTNDEKEFVIPRRAVRHSKVLKEILDDVDDQEETVVPLANVDSLTLEFLAPYLEYYQDKEPDPLEKPLRAPLPDLIPAWEKDYVYKCLFKDGDEKQHEPLFKTLMAANFMGIDPLRDLCCAAIANMLRGKSPEQIMEVFGITEPFTPEEERAVEEEYPWLKEVAEN